MNGQGVVSVIESCVPAINMVLPSGLKPGDYELRVSVGDASGTPQIALPLAGDDGHHRYRIGNIRLQ